MASPNEDSLHVPKPNDKPTYSIQGVQWNVFMIFEALLVMSQKDVLNKMWSFHRGTMYNFL